MKLPLRLPAILSCARLFGALCLMILSGCGAPTHSDLVGSWVMTDKSRPHLDIASRGGHGKITLKQTGEFLSDGFPSDLLYSMPGMHPAPPVTGNGTWKLAELDGEPAVWLSFEAIAGPTELEVPTGTPLLISGHGHRLTLYAFPDDPDQGNRIEFQKVDWNIPR